MEVSLAKTISEIVVVVSSIFSVGTYSAITGSIFSDFVSLGGGNPILKPGALFGLIGYTNPFCIASCFLALQPASTRSYPRPIYSLASLIFIIRLS
jgi:hypothetical protein